MVDSSVISVAGANAIAVSISPLNNYILVGLAAKRLQWAFTPKQMVAQIFKLKTVGAGEDSMEVIFGLVFVLCDVFNNLLFAFSTSATSFTLAISTCVLTSVSTQPNGYQV